MFNCLIVQRNFNYYLITILKKLNREKTNELVRILRIATYMYEIKNMIEHNQTFQKINSLLEKIKPDIEGEELYRTHRDVSDYSIIAARPFPYSPVMTPHFDAIVKKVSSTRPLLTKKYPAAQGKLNIVNATKQVEPSKDANELYQLHASSDYSTLPSKHWGGLQSKKNLRGKKTQKKRNKNKKFKSKKHIKSKKL